MATSLPLGTSLGPFVIQNGSASLLVPLVYGYLYRSQNPELSSSDGYHVLAGGTAVEFHLKSARFSDGRQVSASDVQSTIQAMQRLGPYYGSIFGGILAAVETIEVSNPETVRIRSREPVNLLALGDLPVAEAGSDGSVGAGPFMLEHLDGRRLELRRNPYYVGPPPALDEILVTYYRDPDETWRRLIAGDADLAFHLPIEREALLAEQPDLRGYTARMTQAVVLNLNHDDRLLRDPKLAADISRAIDRTALVIETLKGHGAPAYGCSTDAPAIPYYPQELVSLLQGRPGRSPSAPAKLRALVYFSDSLPLRVATVVQRQLAEAGMDLDLEPLPANAEPPSDWQTEFGYGHAEVDSLLDPNNFESHKPGNLRHYSEARVDRILAEASGTIDARERARLRAELQGVEQEDPPVIPLVFADTLTVVSKKFCDIEMDAPAPIPRLDKIRPCN